jgi:endoglucanase
VRWVAKEKNIPLQLTVFNVGSSNEAKAIHVLGGGVPVVALSIACRHMHSTVEMVDLRDIEHAVTLLVEVLVSIEHGERFAIDVGKGSGVVRDGDGARLADASE